MPDQDDDGTVSIKRRLFYYMSAVDPQGNYLT